MSLSPQLRAVEAHAGQTGATRREAAPQLVDAIRAARQADHTLQEIASVLGCSRQAVHALLRRHG